MWRLLWLSFNNWIGRCRYCSWGAAYTSSHNFWHKLSSWCGKLLRFSLNFFLEIKPEMRDILAKSEELRDVQRSIIMRVRACEFVGSCVCACVCVPACVCVCVRALCVCIMCIVCVYVYTCVHLCTCVWMCVHVCMSVCERLCLRACVCAITWSAGDKPWH